MLEVVTAGATYLVDREKTRWKRIPFETAHPGDGLWIDGGFTLGEVGQRCYAHFAHPRSDGATGRYTSSVVSVAESQAAHREVEGDR